MSKKTSVHIDPQINPQLNHNDRTDMRSKNIHQDKVHLNECDRTADEVKQEINRLYAEAMEKLKGKKGKKTPKENSFKEMIFEINENTTMAQCKELSEKIAELTGFTPLQIAIHRDEGHHNKDGNFVTHYHAHAVFFTLDKNTGKQLARQSQSLSRQNLSKMHDLAAEVFQMQRGSRGEKKTYTKDYREYKKIKERESEILNNALETQETALKLKNDLELRVIDLKAKENDLNAKESDLKAQREKIMQNYETAFNELKRDFKKQKSIFKNICTLGIYNKTIEKNYNTAKNALIASKRDEDIKLSVKDREIEKERLRLKESQEALQKQQRQIQELQLQIVNEKTRNDKLKSYIVGLENEILKEIDFSKEMQSFTKTGELTKPYGEKMENLLLRKIDKAITQNLEKEQSKQQNRGFSRSF